MRNTFVENLNEHGMAMEEQSIYENIRQMRESAGMTQEAAAAALGIHVNTYAGYERGEIRPSTKRLLEIAALFGTNIGTLVCGYEPLSRSKAEKLDEDNKFYRKKLIEDEEYYKRQISRLEETIRDKDELLEAKNQIILMKDKEISSLKKSLSSLSLEKSSENEGNQS